jgi:hypothetical protein
MHEYDTQEPEVQIHEPPALDEKANLLDTLREINQEIKEEVTPLDLAVPGYKRILWARFMPYSVAIPEKNATQFQKRQRAHNPIALDASCDNLANAVQELMLMNKDGNLIPIDSEIPIRFDARLAEAMKLENYELLKSAREVIKALFPTEHSVVNMSATVLEWLNGEIEEDANERFLGES